ncbi:hypothetical protein RB597_009449 [Gaeumannomyces tritici]
MASPPEPELWKRPYPPMRLFGNPNPVIFECQEERELDYTSRWYRLPDVPDFLACTLCHKMYIVDTAIEPSFEAVELPRGRCHFNVPRLTRSLVPAACRSGDVQPIREFAKRRLQIQDCQGHSGVGAEAEVKWFRTKDPRLDWFAACEACNEDILQGTPFRARFVAAPAQPEGEIWACDICVPYIKRALLRFSSLPGDLWDSFVEAANRRAHLPKCEGVPVEKPAGLQVLQWYRPTAETPGDKAQELVLCEACFCDKVSLTSLESGFEVVSPPQQQQQHVLDLLMARLGTAPTTTTTCRGTTLPTTAAFASAAGMQSLDVLRTAARTIVASPPCIESGVVGGTWFALQSGNGTPASPDFAVCAACYAGWIETWGLTGFFTPISGGVGGAARLCNLNPTHPRFQTLLPRLGEAVETGVWAPFLAAARTWAHVPPCPRSDMAAGRRWWGHDDCTVCEECQLSFCAATDGGAALSASLPLRGGVVVAAERMCCMYSPRMRQQWLLACERGSPEGLVAHSRQRLAVYAQTIPQIRFLKGMQELQMAQAMHNGLMSTMYSGMASFREVSGITDGHLHGSNTLGWHSTDEGATSAAFSQKMSAGMAASNGPVAQIMHLAAIWDEWE